MTDKVPANLQEFKARVAQLQAQLTEKLQAAQAAGDIAAIQNLSASFQKELAQLTADFQKSTVNPIPSENAPPPKSGDPASHLYDNPQCNVDLNLTVYDGERNMLLATLNDAAFMNLANDILKDDVEFNSRKHLLKGALRLSPAMAPQIYDIIQTCKDRLGLKLDLDVYVYQDTAFNASCFPSGQGRIYVRLTSAILERFSKEELTFVIGHEIGHTLMNHQRFPVQWLLERGKGHFSPLQAIRLYSWSRGGELSCDRIGLLCGRDFEAAGRAFFKLSSGITDEKFNFALGDYIKQFEDLSSELKNSKIDAEDMYSSHPFSPLRLKALEIFWKSQTYRELIGESGGDISESEMEDQIKGFMSLIEPMSLQEDTSEIVKKAKDFIFVAGYFVAAANGVVENSELQALASLLDPVLVQQGLARVQKTDPAALKKELVVLSESLNMAMPTVSKLNMLRDLAVISGADGTIEASEVQVLYGCCDLLHIRREFIDDVVTEMTRPGPH